MFKRLVPVLAALSLAACGVDYQEAEIDNADVGTETVGDELTLTRGRFETFTGRDGKVYFHLLAGNGQKVLQSQGYTTLASAKSGIKSVQTNGVSEARYLSREASNGDFYFVVTATNGQIIGVSQMYASKANADRGQASVINVVKATVDQAAAVTNDPRFNSFKGLDGKYYFNLRANNGEIVVASQGYTTLAAANNGIASVRTNGTSLSRYTVLPAADGQYYFVLKATNGQIIGRSETFVTKAGAERSVAGVIELLAPRTDGQGAK